MIVSSLLVVMTAIGSAWAQGEDDFSRNLECIRLMEKYEMIGFNTTLVALKGSPEVMTLSGMANGEFMLIRGNGKNGLNKQVTITPGGCGPVGQNHVTAKSMASSYLVTGLAQYMAKRETANRAVVAEVVKACQRAPAFGSDLSSALKTLPGYLGTAK